MVIMRTTRLGNETTMVVGIRARGMLPRVSTTISRFNDLIKPHENNVGKTRGEGTDWSGPKGRIGHPLDVAYGSAISRREFIRLVYTHTCSRP